MAIKPFFHRWRGTKITLLGVVFKRASKVIPYYCRNGHDMRFVHVHLSFKGARTFLVVFVSMAKHTNECLLSAVVVLRSIAINWIIFEWLHFSPQVQRSTHIAYQLKVMYVSSDSTIGSTTWPHSHSVHGSSTEDAEMIPEIWPEDHDNSKHYMYPLPQFTNILLLIGSAQQVGFLSPFTHPKVYLLVDRE